MNGRMTSRRHEEYLSDNVTEIVLKSTAKRMEYKARFFLTLSTWF